MLSVRVCMCMCLCACLLVGPQCKKASECSEVWSDCDSFLCQGLGHVVQQRIPLGLLPHVDIAPMSFVSEEEFHFFLCVHVSVPCSARCPCASLVHWAPCPPSLPSFRSLQAQTYLSKVHMRLRAHTHTICPMQLCWCCFMSYLLFLLLLCVRLCCCVRLFFLLYAFRKPGLCACVPAQVLFPCLS